MSEVNQYEITYCPQDYDRIINRIQRKIQHEKYGDNITPPDFQEDELLNKLEFKRELFKDRHLNISDKLIICQHYEKLSRGNAKTRIANDNTDNFRNVIKKMVVKRKRRTKYDHVIKISNLHDSNITLPHEAAIDNNSRINLVNPNTNESDFLCPQTTKHKSRNSMMSRRSMKSKFNSSMHIISQSM